MHPTIPTQTMIIHLKYHFKYPPHIHPMIIYMHPIIPNQKLIILITTMMDTGKLFIHPIIQEIVVPISIEENVRLEPLNIPK